MTESIEESITAWEKRDYWLKADRFRIGLGMGSVHWPMNYQMLIGR